MGSDHQAIGSTTESCIKVEGINSYEQRSFTDHNLDSTLKPHRLVVVDRLQQESAWSSSNQPSETRSILKWLFSPFGQFRLNITRPRAPATKAAAAQLSSSSGSLAQQAGYHLGPFPSNEWRTSKYTLLTFLPRNLFEQFRRLANFYFLITSLIQLFLPFSPVGPLTSFAPLFFVVGVTSIKQAYEDYLRHQSDKELNNRLCHVLRGQSNEMERVRSKDIKVGDIVYIRNNEEIPCDMIMLSGGGPRSDRCYITTSNLDGETNLKSRNCTCLREQLGDIERINKSLIFIECELPNATLYEFSGFLRAPKTEQAYRFLVNNTTVKDPTGGSKATRENEKTQPASAPSSWDLSSALAVFGRLQQMVSQPNGQHQQKSAMSRVHEIHEIPLDISNLLPRASRLSNTSHIYGLAVYTGPDTKLAQNSHVKPNKFSSTEAKVNEFLMISFMILITFTLISTLRYSKPEVWYLRDLFREDSLAQIALAHFLLYNYLMPISLYVTLEFVKFFGTVSVVEDEKMRSSRWVTIERDDQPAKQRSSNSQKSGLMAASTISNSHSGSKKGMNLANKHESDSKSRRTKFSRGKRRIEHNEGPKCNSSDLNEELGQIEILFTDKTGTLTENRMIFMAASIDGHLFRDLAGSLYLQVPSSKLLRHPAVNVARDMASLRRGRHALLPNLLGKSQHQMASAHRSGSGHPSPNKKETPLSRIPKVSPESHWLPHDRPFDHRINPPSSEITRIKSLEKHSRAVEFFLSLCLCSTITLNEYESLERCIELRNNLTYLSASPDEESFISCANQYGIIMCKSNDKECYILIKRSPGHREPATTANGVFKPIVETPKSTKEFYVRHFRRLAILEFNSSRKRMSVVCEDCDNQCLLMVTKGSEEMLDCLDLSQLTSDMQLRFNLTLAHYEAFSRSGLRTLLVASRLINHDEFVRMEKDIKDIRMSIQNRDQLLDNFYGRAERGLNLIGATAVEDSLQEGVPETIAHLKEAGIKVWLLTGDKVETALSVAHLCRLFDDEMHVFQLVRQRDYNTCQALITSFFEQLADHQEWLANKDKQLQQHHQEHHPAHGIRHQQQHGKVNRRQHQMEPPAPHDKNAYEKKQQFALVADGRSLHYAMRYSRAELASLCRICSCVLGCRLSPLQKAEVVAMMKEDIDRPITAAIGDGANDVSMIQEAHVGIGISGKEGRQAVNSSDFAIGRFHILSRLLFVHGHLFYHRTANIINYFFYKNFLFMAPQFLFSFYNLASAQTLYAPIMMLGFNLFWTSVPIIMYGLSEVHIPESILETYPKLYTMNRKNVQMGISIFFSWTMLGVLQGAIVFYLLLFIWGSHTPLLESGRTSTYNGFPMMVFTAVVALAILRIYFISHKKSFLLHVSSILSFILLPLSLYGYSLIPWAPVADNSFYGQVIAYYRSRNYWLGILIALCASLIPEVIVTVRDQVIFHAKIRSIIKRLSS